MILRKKRAHLVLETTSGVVGFLCVDVAHYGVEVCWPDREERVSALPCKVRNTLLFHPERRGSLQLRNQVSRGVRGGNPDRHMHVVGDTTGAKAFAIDLAGGAGEVSVQFRRDVLGDQWSVVLCAEDDVNKIEAQRLRHGFNVSGLQPFGACSTRYLGLRPRLLCGRAFGPKFLGLLESADTARIFEIGAGAFGREFLGSLQSSSKHSDAGRRHWRARRPRSGFHTQCDSGEDIRP